MDSSEVDAGLESRELMSILAGKDMTDQMYTLPINPEEISSFGPDITGAHPAFH